MFFTRVRLEQATSLAIARYKATLLGDGNLNVADLCCGIGGDTLGLLARNHEVSAFDLDNACCVFTLTNSRVCGYDRLNIVQGDATEVDLAPYDAWHIDPDRRPQGRRTTQVSQQEPSDHSLELMLQRNSRALFKLAPASEVHPSWQSEGHLRWIGHRRECKQLVAGFGGLVGDPGVRSAVVLDEGGQCIAEVAGDPDALCDWTDQFGAYLHQPHAAVRAAGLMHCLADRLGMKAVAEGTSFFTSDQLQSDATLANFQIVATLPYDRKKVRAELLRLNVGRLEIKTAAVGINPQAEHKRLKPKGSESACLFVFPMGGRTVAVLTRRLPLKPGEQF
jgi:hypothetical protein